MTFADLGLTDDSPRFDFGGSADAQLNNQAELYRNDFLAFTAAQKRGYVVNWHHEQLARALEAVQRGEIRILLVMMPPREGKSELVSRAFPAWCMGRNPNERIIATSHTAELAESMSRDVQNVMDGETYLSTFDTRLKSGAQLGQKTRKSLKETERLFDVAIGGDGYYLAAGVGGSITGRGGSLMIVDDPVKDVQEAESPVFREKQWKWLQHTLRSRGESTITPEGVEIKERLVICMTPWHEDDISGRMLRYAKATGEKVVVVRFPATYEPSDAANQSLYQADPEWCKDPRRVGDPLWRRTKEEYAAIEARGARFWNSNYQCRPAPEQGNMFKRTFWKWYKDPSELPKFDMVAFSLDAAFKDNPTSSRVVLGKWGLAGNKRYLLDGWAGHMGIVKTMALCRTQFAGESAPSTKLIEDKANGTAIIEMLQDEFHGIVPIEPRGGKVARAVASIPIIEGGDVYLPDYLPFAHALVDECAAFPYGEHDDMPDMVSQLIQHYHYNPITWLSGMVGRVA